MRHPVDYPLWRILDHQGRSLKWLASRMGYGYNYVRQVRAGVHPVTEEFRQRAAQVMDLPDEVLFILPECAGRRTERIAS